MTNRYLTESQRELSLPWVVSAALVAIGSVLIATWMNTTAVAANSDTLSRGADAVKSAIEEQVKVLELAGTGTASMIGTPITEFDLETVVKRMDVTLLRSMLAAVIYPVGTEGVEEGTFIAPGLIQVPGLEVPVLEIDRYSVEQLAAAGEIYLSPPIHTTDADRLDYVLALPEGSGEDLRLIAMVFRPDRMLDGAVDATGGDQYAVNLIDVRYDDQLIVSMGQPSSGLITRRQPDGLQGALQVEVQPGEEFPFASSDWLTATVVVTGWVIASLLVLMGRMARARARDLSERLRLAQELSDSKDRFLATVSHELRTPLTVVLGVAAEVGPNWDAIDSGERIELLSMLSEQAGEAANIVEDLLVAARSDPSQLRLAVEATHLRPHVEYALGSLAAADRERVAHNACDHRVQVDSSRLRQIMRNLLENAVRYGGDKISIDCRKDAESVVIVVSDNGDSLHPDDVDRIFEPYEQSQQPGDESPKGVGIGLYVSRLLARLMNGELDCVREDGHTQFRLTLPRAVAVPVSVTDDPEPALTT
ncbi:MAG: HAMP domain-containing sensor histidine kinase [Acidimicrobiia bacterium]|nr:HAMP domain-containing sensor histidine kinase [Acidimicrobiia bacterium]